MSVMKKVNAINMMICKLRINDHYVKRVTIVINHSVQRNKRIHAIRLLWGGMSRLIRARGHAYAYISTPTTFPFTDIF